MNLNTINHTPQSKMHLNEIKEALELPIIPYLVIVECFLLLGDKVLSEKKETPPQPFCNEPRFETSFSFSDIKVSQLPLETRIGINVIGISDQGDSLILGCVCLNLFNTSGKLIQGRVTLNLWPFYCVQPRMACMGEYNCKIPSDPKGTPKCSITIQFNTYACDMYYSLRDGDIMEYLGFQRKLDGSMDLEQAADSNDLVQVNKILTRDPTNLNLTKPEKIIIIKARSHLKFLSNALPIFLEAIDW